MSKGFTAREIEQIKNGNKSDWDEMHRIYDEWQKSIRILSVKGAYILAAVGAILYFFVDYTWVKIIVVVILLYTVSSYQRWEGHREGYVDGYIHGRDAGVNQALGIDDKTASMISEMAIEAEVGEMK
jgi:hypothetical protein